MDRLRTLLALAAIALTTAMVGSAGMTAAYAEDFQAQGRPLNDPANQRNINDPATARNLNDQQDPNKSRLNDPANARNVDDKDSKRDTK